jgi:hypothetical protein
MEWNVTNKIKLIDGWTNAAVVNRNTRVEANTLLHTGTSSKCTSFDTKPL